MKKILMIVLVFIMAMGLCGFTTEKETLDEHLVELLVDAGYEEHGDVWTKCGFVTDEESKTDYYVVGWYNVKDNFGAVTGKSVMVTSFSFNGKEPTVKYNDSYDYVTFRYDYDAGDIEIIDIYGYNY